MADQHGGDARKRHTSDGEVIVLEVREVEHTRCAMRQVRVVTQDGVAAGRLGTMHDPGVRGPFLQPGLRIVGGWWRYGRTPSDRGGSPCDRGGARLRDDRDTVAAHRSKERQSCTVGRFDRREHMFARELVVHALRELPRLQLADGDRVHRREGLEVVAEQHHLTASSRVGRARVHPGRVAGGDRLIALRALPDLRARVVVDQPQPLVRAEQRFAEQLGETAPRRVADDVELKQAIASVHETEAVRQVELRLAVDVWHAVRVDDDVNRACEIIGRDDDRIALHQRRGVPRGEWVARHEGRDRSRNTNCTLHRPSSSSMVFGQSFFIKRDNDRSASNLPSV